MTFNSAGLVLVDDGAIAASTNGFASAPTKVCNVYVSASSGTLAAATASSGYGQSYDCTLTAFST